MLNAKPLRSVGLHTLWLAALLRRRTGRVMATAVGVTLAVGLLASLGTFLAASKATMTRRAVDTVAVDWQVESRPGTDLTAFVQEVAASRHVTASEVVSYATTSGFQSTNEGSTQTTGPGQVLGVSDQYRSTFPAQFRDLIGDSRGVLLFQQTAANLAAQPGQTISVGRAGLDSAAVTIDGIIDIPQADSLFQAVGAPSGSQPQAPPDNVLIVPDALWHQLFDPLADQRPDLVRVQVHARLDHRLPSDPAAAYSDVAGEARNLEARLAGAGLVGDNLGSVLASARSDALYAQVLFLFLGTPGAVLAALLTASVAAAGRVRRRREQALLRARGATTRQLVGLGIGEALMVGAIGSALGIGLAALVGRLAFGSARFGATTGAAVTWSVAAVVVGLVIAALTIVVPSRRDARHVTVMEARLSVGRRDAPRWMLSGLDLLLLGVAAVAFWVTSRNGYQLVLAVEGVPSISVDYWSFAGPALLWVGSGLLSYRLTYMLVGRGRGLVSGAMRPLSGGLAGTVAASLQRQRRLVARGAALVSLTIGFAASTAIFNATYRQQVEVDAVLSNGADVTVTTSPGANVAPNSLEANAIAATPGVNHVEPIQHRFAYVGADLQDLYGVVPSSIVAAGRLQDSYFQGGSAHQLIDQLETQPDALLVSAETVHDFQLLPGDLVTLRLLNGATKQYAAVPFHYVGVVKEFPTAPRDSFLVANADYIASQTGTGAVGAFLVDTGGRSISAVANELRHQLGANANVTDLVSSRKIVGSSLTAVDLDGLTRVELGFAVALAAAATGLTLWLGLTERRRTFAIATALGANQRQLGAFVWAEALITTGAGFITGAAGGWALSSMLVKVLQGVFDPTPDRLAVPWTYLVITATVASGTTIVASIAAIRHARTPHLELLRTS